MLLKCSCCGQSESCSSPLFRTPRKHAFQDYGFFAVRCVSFIIRHSAQPLSHLAYSHLFNTWDDDGRSLGIKLLYNRRRNGQDRLKKKYQVGLSNRNADTSLASFISLTSMAFSRFVRVPAVTALVLVLNGSPAKRQNTPSPSPTGLGQS